MQELAQVDVDAEQIAFGALDVFVEAVQFFCQTFEVVGGNFGAVPDVAPVFRDDVLQHVLAVFDHLARDERVPRQRRIDVVQVGLDLETQVANLGGLGFDEQCDGVFAVDSAALGFD